MAALVSTLSGVSSTIAATMSGGDEGIAIGVAAGGLVESRVVKRHALCNGFDSRPLIGWLK